MHGVRRRSPARDDRHRLGREGLLARQRIRGARLALGEIRGGVSRRLRLSPEARTSIGRSTAFYNAVRPQAALGGRTPDQKYFRQPLLAAA